MPELLEKETVEETEITITKEYTNEDLLDRQPFIDKVKTIIEFQAAQKKNCCFAINGSWGVGKTFVLNKLEEQLEEIVDEKTSNDKYLIFHYNCWQYDYYEEPLVAIVSSMLDTIDEKVNLIPEGTKKALLEKAKGLLKIVGSALLVKANDEIKEKTGVDIEKLAEFVSNTNDILSQGTDDIKTFDSNFLFKKTLIKLQQTLQILSKEKTIIFVVDELDRCLPEYAIKVLERLHHVFEDVSNVQTILSIDKDQLEHIVKTTFGTETSTQKYLSKFISFYLNLDEGEIHEKLFDLRFRYYTRQFSLAKTNNNINQIVRFKTQILSGIDTRQRIEIIDKCNLIHGFLFSNEPVDYYFMCIELFLTVLKTFDVVKKRNKKQERFDILNIFAFDDNDLMPIGLKKINKAYEKNNSMVRPYYKVEDDGFTIVNGYDIYGVILAAYMQTIPEKIDDYNFKYPDYDYYFIIENSKKFWDLLQIIS